MDCCKLIPDIGSQLDQICIIIFANLGILWHSGNPQLIFRFKVVLFLYEIIANKQIDRLLFNLSYRHGNFSANQHANFLGTLV